MGLHSLHVLWAATCYYYILVQTTRGILSIIKVLWTQIQWTPGMGLLWRPTKNVLDVHVHRLSEYMKSSSVQERFF